MHVKVTPKIEILQNWLPRFILKLLCSSKLFTFPTVLTMVAHHPTIGPAIKKAVAAECAHGRATVDDWLTVSLDEKGDGCENYVGI